VGKIVEAVSGQRLGDYLQEHLFAPLGMHSTSLHIAPCGRTLQPSPLDQGPARCALEAYVPRLITSPSS
jgi:CubicO group peptidase (beta-lactamase class C family)